MSELKKTTIIDMSSGEIVYEKSKRLTIFDEERGYLFWKNKQAVRSFPGVSFPIELNEREQLHFYKLSHLIYSDTNCLAYRGHKNVIKPYTMESMAGHIGIAYRNATVLIKKLIDLGLMARVVVHTERKRETQYYINPIYFFSGIRINLNLYLLFRTQLDRYLPAWVKERFLEQEAIFTKSLKRKK